MYTFMKAFRGDSAVTISSVTYAEIYQMLNDGENVYIKEFSPTRQPKNSSMIDVKYLQFCVPLLWEPSQKRVKGKNFKPCAVVHIDANIKPDDVNTQLGHPVYSKIKFLYTGEDPLQHFDEVTLIDNILRAAQKLNSFLPVLFSLGVKCFLSKVTQSEIEEYSEVLKTRGDRREAQVIFDFDNLFLALKVMISKYELENPLLFNTEGIDRMALVYFNTDQEEKTRMEKLGQEIITNIETKGLFRSVVRSGFKIKVADFPPVLANKLGCLKSNSTTFGGARGQRVSFLPETHLSDVTVTKLKQISNSRYSLWSQAASQKRGQVLVQFGTSFYTSRESAASNREDTIDLNEDVDTNMSVEVGDDTGEKEATTAKKAAEPTDGTDYTCDNKYCKDFGKAFKYKSQKTQHERAGYHKDAAKYKF